MRHLILGPESNRSQDQAPAHKAGTPSIWALRRARRNPIEFLQRLSQRGDIASFSMRGQPVFLLSHPDHIEEVLRTHGRRFVKPPALDRAARLLGQGLLTAPPALHSIRRRVIQPAFHRKQIHRSGGIMVAHAAALRDRWEAGQVVDLMDEMGRLTLGIVGEALFAANLDASSAEIRQQVAEAVDAFDPLVALVAPRHRLRPAAEGLRAHVRLLIARYVEDDQAQPDGLLGLLLGAHGAEATAEQLEDDALTMLLAGHDTIANALAWTWVLLDRYPEVDVRLFRELQEVLGNRVPTMDDLPRLPWTRAVFTESLRVRPPAWIIARRAAEPHRIHNVEIPAGALVLMSPYLVHHDARFFRDPSAFDPERWLREPHDRPSGLAFFPFGAGKRSCIGESFAWTEGILVLATLASRWRLCLAMDSVVQEPKITLRPASPLHMMLSSRP